MFKLLTLGGEGVAKMQKCIEFLKLIITALRLVKELIKLFN